LKLRVLAESDEIVLEENLTAQEGKAELATVQDFLSRAGELAACGVRVVHGGPHFHDSVRVDEGVLRKLDDVSELAPLHNPPALAAMRELLKLRPDLVQVACFDTAFHATLKPAAYTYAIPRRWTEEWGVRRYGFHGLSHAYCSRRVRELTGASRVVTCHLGAGASLCAVRDGESVDTTMGFTPMEGLVMATRSGSLDPGAILWVERRHHLDARATEKALDRESGLLGLAGTADMRAIVEAVDRDERAALALAVYVHRLRASIAAMAAALGGVDALAFTGGIGENAAAVRSKACAGLGFLGIELDESRNASMQNDAEVGKDGARVRVFVIRAREDLEIAREVRSTLR
jgi:acetate kinase